jgi:ribonuclease R
MTKQIAHTSGKLIVNEFGNGFVNQDNKSIYINKKDLNRAFNNEIVDLEYYQDDDLKYYGKVINYSLVGKSFIGSIHHTFKKIIYIYVSELSQLITIDTSKKNNKIFIPKNSWIYLTITEDVDNVLQGKIIEILKPDVDELIEKKFNLSQISNNINNIQHNSQHLDQTNLDTFTIDPITCNDCDDAFSIDPIPDTDLLNIYVHISDVAHYINPSIGPEFKKIINRGNTYYGSNKNWTMIPREYADNHCSILPNKETKVVTTHFIFNTHTKELEYQKWFYSTIISKHKYHYELVDETFESNNDFLILYETSQIIKKTIPDIILNYESKSHEMIKYWMLKTNQVMSNQINRLYRCNPEPNSNNMKMISEYFKFSNLATTSDTIQRQDIINLCENHKSQLTNFMIKNILQKAYYTEENSLHYGIGMLDYTHWTSPIRRAADLLNHCILKGYDIDITQYLENINQADSKQNQIEFFIQEFNNNHKVVLNQELDAIIIGLTPVGCVIYVNDLDYKYSVHISRMTNERLVYNKELNQLKGESADFKLFDNIKVKVSKISMNTIEFTIVQ